MEKKRASEKTMEFGRNFNGAVAVGAFVVGAVVAPPLAVAANAYGAFNAAQAAGFEGGRRWLKKRDKKKKKKKNSKEKKKQ